ncbi:MAG: fluoride efflux transporter CrcB [Clostridiales Family XIII bacterium]|jgi:CrcB protein|nr:fluoride efflux transporter CrcB [Clostridiales Family XIII bacterium]
MLNFFSVGIGAAVGACLRYAISRALPTEFPYGTLISNVAAAFLIGFVIGAERNTGALPERVKLLITTGLLGGLSTFSTFSMETIAMLETRNYAGAGANVLLNVGICLFCVAAGLAIARLVS